jgi:hypothetical protein
MTWANFYLICFGTGFALSVLSFLGVGARARVHLPGHLHLPHFGHTHFGHGVHGARLPGGRIAAPAGHAGGAGHGAARVGPGSVSPFDFTTMTAFLAWFGGVGYLLTEYSRVWALLGLGIATLSGLGGASIVFLFLTRVLLAHEASLDQADYEMPGVL